MTDFEQICLCAVRYGLGRQTYITGVIADFMMRQHLGDKCKAVMARDIQEAQKKDRLGAECDKKSWLNLLEFLTKPL